MDIASLVDSIPRRYTIYPPLLLLPAHFFSTPTSWKHFVSTSTTAETMETLYRTIVHAFAPHAVTHLALNSPISVTTPDGVSNVTRSPINLTPLHGDFGPRALEDDQDINAPSESDLQAAFWISATQNDDIAQSWAPLWTMFSRGNVSEKSRILGRTSNAFQGLDSSDDVLGQNLRQTSVVDMYVGIGYFAFSYLSRGVGRVWGWEMNGWSIEGLRRGCRRNGWGIRILKVDESGTVEDQEGRIGEVVLENLAREIGGNDNLRIVAFWGDNRWARSTLERIKSVMDRDGPERSLAWLNIRHVNLGLLPSSKLAWGSAIDMIDPGRGGWIHIHENTDVREIDETRDLIIGQLRAHSRGSKEFSCSHVEHVKTYAPGVMHCVFDVHVGPI